MHVIRKISGVLTSIIAVLAVVFAVALVGVRIVGLTPYAVLSGSMEPTYHVGSMIYVKQVKPKDLKIGDPITFLIADETIVTHRIVDVTWDTEDVLWFKTKGDANKDPDAELVDSRNVLGVPVYSVPMLGYVSNFVSTFPGIYITLGIVVIIVAICLWPEEDDEEEHEE